MDFEAGCDHTHDRGNDDDDDNGCGLDDAVVQLGCSFCHERGCWLERDASVEVHLEMSMMSSLLKDMKAQTEVVVVHTPA